MSALYSIPSGVPFLRALARGLIARHPTEDDPFALSRVMVYLPTRRAIRGLEEAFLEALGTRASAALLLPKLKALGEADEEELVLASEESAEIPPSISATQRLLWLAECLERVAPAFEDALHWAKSLARFLDEVLIEEADLSRLGAALPQDLAGQFEASRNLLQIIGANWQAILAEDGLIERAERRRRLMEAQIGAWTKAPPEAVYIAGSTGTIPVTQRLMQSVLGLPKGAVILPGLDQGLDEAAWNAIGDTHPQASLKHLLERLEISRGEVEVWPHEDRVPEARNRLVSEALRPAPTTDSWSQALSRFSLREGVSGLSVLTARDRAEEARAIALAMREVLEQPGQTAALATPDRGLARRVAAELLRWGIVVDDSAGIPLLETVPARFLRLLLAAVENEFAPVPLLGLMKHPAFRLWSDWTAERRATSLLERLALRGARPRPGFAGIRARLTEEVEGDAPSAALDARTLSLELVASLEVALRALTERQASRQTPVEWVRALSAAAEACSRDLWEGPAADAMSLLLDEIAQSQVRPLSLGEFITLIEQTGEGRAVRPKARTHPRLAIWGLLEARLQSADLLILGGLNEGVWPAIVDRGPWANRAMRDAMGLSSPERWVGLAAHDFAELAAGPRVLLTVAKKIDSSPAKHSRFLLRLENVLGLHGKASDTPYIAWAQELASAKVARPVKEPTPAPPVELRPKRFAITEIAKLRRDPYAIYAKHILRLKPLDPVDADTLALDRGNLFHGILEDFVRAHPDELPALAHEAFEDAVTRRLTAQSFDPDVERMLRGRLSRMTGAFLRWEKDHRKFARNVAVEIKGALGLNIGGTPITLRGRIDRIDADRKTGALIIFDYKTGGVPSKRQVEIMLEPQLPLGALLALRGAFPEIGARSVERLAYLRINGGNNEIETPRFDNAEDLILETERGLVGLLAEYLDPGKPYLSWPIRERQDDEGDYDLLARVGEWRAAEDDEE